MAEWYKQRRAARDKGDYSNIPAPPRSPVRTGRGGGRAGTSSYARGGSLLNRPYPNRRERDSRKRNVSFGRGDGVYVTTDVSNDPTRPAWADAVSDAEGEDDNTAQGNGLGQ